MPDVIDGSFNDSEGRRKSFVRKREGETEEEFANRTMAFFELMGLSDVVDRPSDPEADRRPSPPH